MQPTSFVIDDSDIGKRLDVFLVEKLGISRGQIQKFIENGKILLNNNIPKKAGEKLKLGNLIEFVEVSDVDVKTENIIIDFSIYDDIKVVADETDYLIIDKPAGLLTHPTEAKEPVSLTSWIFKNYPKLSGVGEYQNRPGIVHRLDKDASGLLVIAKNQEMFDLLKNQFQKREIDKEYLVLVYGLFAKNHDVIDFEIDRGNDGRMVARPKIDVMKVKNVGKKQHGKEAKSEYWLEKEYKRFSLLRVKIYTGRTHQIRVHMFAVKHPVVGDTIYEDKKLLKKGDQPFDRLFLHSVKLGFTDLAGKRQAYTLSIREELQNYLNNLK